MSPLRRPPAELAQFPRYELQTSQQLFRIHRRELGAWWFSHDASGRFDLQPPWGTCYVAEDAIGAFVEVFRDTRVVAQSDVDGRVLSTLNVLEDIFLADCTVSRARAFGITAAIHSSENYERTQAWAAAFADAGFGGIRYFVSHDPAQLLVGIALFGPAGAPDHPVAETRSIESHLILRARERFGIVVLPAPA